MLTDRQTYEHANMLIGPCTVLLWCTSLFVVLDIIFFRRTTMPGDCLGRTPIYTMIYFCAERPVAVIT